MIVVIDVDYGEKEAYVAGVFAEEVHSAESCGFLRLKVKNYGDYESGQFYKRELPCVKAILEKVNPRILDFIIVDGYADFGTERVSLGQAVYGAYGIPTIGIAKKACQYCVLLDTEVFRGSSRSPLFVTSYGITQEEAKSIVREMSGKNRLPYLVKLADSYARGSVSHGIR